ncbi:hypothetical protein H9Q13_04945 [Pontibacter sp. JH31]|uniref:STAS/SEC14 domain-containing protein n=1 Tax=Pontibacter aquaedesilientis TaxID=2766980 RepID=A0ABR7XDY1_9BACT|nr:hypothetical protein [Pontibacter aquaedesilientis]MBD1396503.1 hypothetical protein [Pontibacter aquaedesilientis]
MVIYNTDYIKILYHEQHKMVETVWLGFAGSKDYRAALDQYIDVLQTHEVRRWLGDQRQARVVRPVDQQWTVRTWAPVFVTLIGGIKKMARVKSKDVAALISSDNMRHDIDFSKLPLEFRDFEDYDKAKAWLLE